MSSLFGSIRRTFSALSISNDGEYYEYEDIQPDQTRIINLQPGSKQDAISLSLTCEAVGQSSEQKYDAVSYVWGSPKFSKVVECNGALLKVTANVFELLQRLRDPTNHVKLWIDAVCINQQDVVERNHQVSLMKDIYSSADQVLIWTGKANSHTEFLFASLKSLAEDDVNALTDRNVHRHVTAFAKRPWFHRAWTFQELCLAKDAQVLCGNYQVPWSTIAGAFCALESRGLSQAIFGEVADCMMASSRFYASAPDKRQPNLSVCLPLTRNLKATDPRDKVFAILGLVDTFQLENVKPDYKQSVAEVYTQYANAIITQEQGLSIFSSVLRGHQGKDLPSWVPDWRLSRRTAYLHGYEWPAMENSYNINQHCPLEFSLNPHIADTKITLRGARLGNVIFTSRGEKLLKALPLDGHLSTKPVASWNSFFPRFMLLFKSLQLPEIYKQTGEPSSMAFLRTLTANHLPAPSAMQKFARKTMTRIHEKKKYFDDRDNKLKNHVNTPAFKEAELKLQKSNNAGEDIDTFVFLYQMALDVLDFELPQPRGSFFGTIQQRIFGSAESYSVVDYIISMAQTFMRNRVVFTTDNGLLGIGPDSMAVGDQVWNLLGGSVPFVLCSNQGGISGKYSLVGECYVHGVMNGELWQRPGDENDTPLDGQGLKFENVTII